MSNNSSPQVQLVASGLRSPQGPTVLPDGRVIFVESYCSQLTAVGVPSNAAAFRLCRGGAELIRPRGRWRDLRLSKRPHIRQPLSRQRDVHPVNPAGSRGG